MKEIKHVTVLGAGSMGAPIAALASEAGYQVIVRDIENKYLERGRETINILYFFHRVRPLSVILNTATGLTIS